MIVIGFEEIHYNVYVEGEDDGGGGDECFERGKKKEKKRKKERKAQSTISRITLRAEGKRSLNKTDKYVLVETNQMLVGSAR